MGTDALAKAAEALFYAVSEWCRRECDLWGEKCLKAACRVPKLALRSDDPARAVLEAVGYEQLVNIVRDAKLLLPQLCETCGERPDCSECGWQVLGERIKAALQRAGKE